MITFDNMKTHVGSKIGKADSTFKTKIGYFLNERYEDIWNQFNYPPLVKTISSNSTADTETMVISARDIDYILDIHDRVNDIHLTPITPQRGGREHADTQDSSGTPRLYWWEGVTVKAQPTSTSVLAISSNSTSDTTQKVRIFGTTATGEEISEEVTLAGTSTVNTTNSYSTVSSVSKDANTLGLITATANGGSVTVFEIDPYDFAPRYIKIHLVKRPDAAITYTITYKKKFRPLIGDSDVPLIPCEIAMKIGAYADCLKEQKNWDRARMIEQNPTDEYDPSTYTGALNRFIEKYSKWMDAIPQATPHIEKDSIDSVSNSFHSF